MPSTTRVSFRLQQLPSIHPSMLTMAWSEPTHWMKPSNCRNSYRQFARGGFLFRKWKASQPEALNHLSQDLLDPQSSQAIRDPAGFTKALGIEWSVSLDCFRLTVSEFPGFDVVTKRALISDVAKTSNVIGWFAPVIVKVKILLQSLWEAGTSLSS